MSYNVQLSYFTVGCAVSEWLVVEVVSNPWYQNRNLCGDFCSNCVP